MEPVILPGQTYSSVTTTISDAVLKRPISPLWVLGLLWASAWVSLLLIAIVYLFARGVGIWGINIPVAWGFAITNFVWWIGIGHAGTFISAFLLLMRQSWRTSINRFAEAMTIFAVSCAGVFPLLHLGRPWFFYWLLPYPDTMDLWPQFRSPLIWDIFAVLTYFSVSLIFWYVGLIPDFAILKDRAKRPWVQKTYGVLALGWRGSAYHWRRYETAYLLLAGLATPLVVSVHSIVSLDFTAAIVPGWHSTIFPPYFVAGAIFSGFAMVLTLGLPLRKFYALEAFITERHLNNCAKLMLTTGMIVTYSYIMEFFMAWYSGDRYEQYVEINRELGAYSLAYWALIFCNVGVTQLLWFRQIRSSPPALFAISLLINIGMWLERFVIVVTSLQRDFLTSSWGMYAPTIWDWITFAGTLGLFIFLFLLFIRFLPSISITEVRKLVHETSEEGAPHG